MSNAEKDIENISRQISLKNKQFEFISELAKKYKLVDESKTIRCLIEFARAEPDKLDEIFSKVRCAHC